MQKDVAKIGMIPFSSPPPEELQAFIDSEIVRWAKVVQRAGIAGSQ
jgi:tripartite-type tricarboxylate transporter receptor subunit TctC